MRVRFRSGMFQRRINLSIDVTPHARELASNSAVQEELQYRTGQYSTVHDMTHKAV